MNDSIFEPMDIDTDSLSDEILAAASLLHPDKPEPLESQSMVPYFESCGMAEDHIVPSGLRDYTEAVLKILGLSTSVENLNRILERADVKQTLTQAITAANKVYDAQNNASINMPDMSLLKGVDAETMGKFIQKAEQEEAMKEARTFSEPKEEPKLEEKPEALPEVTAPAHEMTHFCPRCGWITDLPYKRVELTEDDKVKFVYSIMQRLPFKKSYKLFNGQMTITFRSRVPEDKELILEQGRYDIQKERYADINSMQYWAGQYELALLLDDIECPSAEAQNIKLKVKPVLKDYLDKPDGLRDYTNAVMDYIGTDALMRLISEHYRTFESTYTALVDEALDENFYHPA